MVDITTVDYWIFVFVFNCNIIYHMLLLQRDSGGVDSTHDIVKRRHSGWWVTSGGRRRGHQRSPAPRRRHAHGGHVTAAGLPHRPAAARPGPAVRGRHLATHTSVLARTSPHRSWRCLVKVKQCSVSNLSVLRCVQKQTANRERNTLGSDWFFFLHNKYQDFFFSVHISF